MGMLRIRGFSHLGKSQERESTICMNTNRKNSRWAGVFYIIATVAPLLTYPFIGFLGDGNAGDPIPGYLVHVAANETQVIIGMLLELTYALAVVGIIVTLFPVLKRHHETSALGFFSFRLMEAISILIHSLSLLLLLTLSQQYVAAGMPDMADYQVAGSLLLASREWVFLIGSGIVWSLSALILNVLLLQKSLIPRWLSGWGLVGAGLSFVAYGFQFFNINLPELSYLPIGVQEMVFAGWLIVKGIDSSNSVRVD
jgi:hypothetical protein